MSESLLEIYGTDNIHQILIVSFGGSAQKFSGIPPFEFLRSLNEWYPDIDKKFYKDLNYSWYHHGIKDITSNIDETVVYLRKVICDYKKVIFIGASAGGYAAILFGSLLSITDVIAFIPQTILVREDLNLEEKYKNLKWVINDITNYHLYGDTGITDINEVHHMLHIDNISNHENVKVYAKHNLHLSSMRNNGELRDFLTPIIYG
jgi:molybdopterin converting factor small subunit